MEEAESGGFIHVIRQKNVQFFFPSLLKGRVRDGYKAGKEGKILIFVHSDPIGSQTCSNKLFFNLFHTFYSVSVCVLGSS